MLSCFKPRLVLVQSTGRYVILYRIRDFSIFFRFSVIKCIKLCRDNGTVCAGRRVIFGRISLIGVTLGVGSKCHHFSYNRSACSQGIILENIFKKIEKNFRKFSGKLRKYFLLDYLLHSISIGHKDNIITNKMWSWVMWNVTINIFDFDSFNFKWSKNCKTLLRNVTF